MAAPTISYIQASVENMARVANMLCVSLLALTPAASAHVVAKGHSKALAPGSRLVRRQQQHAGHHVAADSSVLQFADLDLNRDGVVTHEEMQKVMDGGFRGASLLSLEDLSKTSEQLARLEESIGDLKDDNPGESNDLRASLDMLGKASMSSRAVHHKSIAEQLMNGARGKSLKAGVSLGEVENTKQASSEVTVEKKPKTLPAAAGLVQGASVSDMDEEEALLARLAKLEGEISRIKKRAANVTNVTTPAKDAELVNATTPAANSTTPEANTTAVAGANATLNETGNGTNATKSGVAKMAPSFMPLVVTGFAIFGASRLSN